MPVFFQVTFSSTLQEIALFLKQWELVCFTVCEFQFGGSRGPAKGSVTRRGCWVGCTKNPRVRWEGGWGGQRCGSSMVQGSERMSKIEAEQGISWEVGGSQEP